jgi:hypothetical protein
MARHCLGPAKSRAKAPKNQGRLDRVRVAEYRNQLPVPGPHLFQGDLMRTHTSLAILFTIAFAPLTLAAPQDSRMALTAQDRSEIQELVARYARALAACAAEEYAELFSPQTGYFASNIRGEVTGRDRLIALVRSERHCHPSGGLANPANAAGGAPRPANVPMVTIEERRQAVPGDREQSPAAAIGRADLGNAGSYEDEYVKTPNGWRFESRTVISRQEQAAGLTSREIAAIRRLAGTDLGLFDDVYVTGPDGIRRFRASGVAMGLSPEGVTGRAALKGGGRYDDVYVRMPQGGWRFTSRIFVPDDPPSPPPATGAAR